MEFCGLRLCLGTVFGKPLLNSVSTGFGPRSLLIAGVFVVLSSVGVHSTAADGRKDDEAGSTEKALPRSIPMRICCSGS